MIELPKLLLQDIAFRVDGTGRLEFCEPNSEAVLAEFELTIVHDGEDDWQITGVTMGAQALRPGSEFYIRCVQHFTADKRIDTIHDHVSDNYADAVEGRFCGYDKTAPRTMAFELEGAA
jgi:hypothetical protein